MCTHVGIYNTSGNIYNTIYSGLIYTEALIMSCYEKRGSWTQEMLQTTVCTGINGCEIPSISLIIFNWCCRMRAVSLSFTYLSCPYWHKTLWAGNSCQVLLCILHEIKSHDLSWDLYLSPPTAYARNFVISLAPIQFFRQTRKFLVMHVISFNTDPLPKQYPSAFSDIQRNKTKVFPVSVFP